MATSIKKRMARAGAIPSEPLIGELICTVPECLPFGAFRKEAPCCFNCQSVSVCEKRCLNYPAVCGCHVKRGADLCD